MLINKGELKWFGHVEHQTDDDWFKCCMTLKVGVMCWWGYETQYSVTYLEK